MGSSIPGVMQKRRPPPRVAPPMRMDTGVSQPRAAHEAADKLFLANGIVLEYQRTLFPRVVGDYVVGAFATTGEGGSGTVQLHYVGAAPHWINRELLRTVFTYCFDFLAAKVILGFLPSERAHAIHVATKLGFKKFGVIPGAGIQMMTMTRAECKWLGHERS